MKLSTYLLLAFLMIIPAAQAMEMDEDHQLEEALRLSREEAEFEQARQESLQLAAEEEEFRKAIELSLQKPNKIEPKPKKQELIIPKTGNEELDQALEMSVKGKSTSIYDVFNAHTPFWRKDPKTKKFGIVPFNQNNPRDPEYTFNAKRISKLPDELKQQITEYLLINDPVEIPGKAESAIVCKGHTGEVICAKYNHDCTKIITASRDNTARIWDAATGRCLAVLQGHTQPLTDACFNHNSSRAATSSEDGNVRIWDPATGQCLHTIRISTIGCNSVQFDTTGNKIICTSERWVNIRNANTGQLINVIRCQFDIFSVRFVDNRYVIIAGGDALRIRDRHYDDFIENSLNNAMDFPCHEPGIRFTMDRNGSLIATASHDRTARIGRLYYSGLSLYQPRYRLEHILHHDEPIRSISLSDSSKAVTTTTHGNVTIWCTNSGEWLNALQCDTAIGPINTAELNNDGNLLLTAQGNIAQVRDLRPKNINITFEQFLLLKLLEVEKSNDGIDLNALDWRVSAHELRYILDTFNYSTRAALIKKYKITL